MKKLRIVINMLMYLLFIVLMGHHITGNLIHEILGTVLIVLFIIHNVLNFRFYSSLFKGKYPFKRILLTITDVVLLLAMIGIVVSSLNISSEVFAFLKIHTTSFGLKLHMLSTSWAFLIMSLHVGLHLNGLISRVHERLKKSVLEYIFYFVFLLLGIYGIYSFIKLNLISDLLLLSPFKAYDFEESPIVFYLHVIATSFFMAMIMNLIGRISFKKKNNMKETR